MKWQPAWLTHLLLSVASTIMLVPFYWLLKTSLSGENLFVYPPRLWPESPHIFYFVDVWYAVPFVRYLWNSVVVSVIAVTANVVLNSMAGYALAQGFRGQRGVVLLLLSCMMIPYQVTVVPAYLITRDLGLLNTHLGMALPVMSTIVCIFIFKANFSAIPKSLTEAARIDGMSEWRIIREVYLPLSKAAVATNVVLSFVWSWNSFLWPLLVARDQSMQTLPLGLATFLSVVEDTSGALYAFCVMVLVPGMLVFLLAQRHFIAGLTAGATKG
jgi:ABC-type glycerol-3-phosphate transport system permease component